MQPKKHSSHSSEILPEILKVCLLPNDAGQKISVNPAVFQDPAAWGLLLVDIARMLAEGYHHGNPEMFDPDFVLQRIKAGFDAEMAYNTQDEQETEEHL